MLKRSVDWMRFLDEGDDDAGDAPAVKSPPSVESAFASAAATGGALDEEACGAASCTEGGANACAWLLDDFSTVARARGEGRYVDSIDARNLGVAKDANSSPAGTEAGETTATDESMLAEADDGEEGGEEEEALAPRPAAIDEVAAALGEVPERPGSPGAESSSRSSNRSSSEGSRRRRKKPPQGLPPTCLVDGVSAMMPRRPQGSSRHMQSWCSAPVCAPLRGDGPGAAALPMPSVESRALETERRAEWVQDAAMAV